MQSCILWGAPGERAVVQPKGANSLRALDAVSGLQKELVGNRRAGWLALSHSFDMSMA